jgi:predicted nuclease of predicted toxin-antitoxin system
VKLLLDTCVSGQTALALRQSGHDVIWAGDWKPDPGDENILRAAVAESRVLVTIDKDFGELAIAHGQLHVGMIRLVGFRAKDQGPAIARLVAVYDRDQQPPPEEIPMREALVSLLHLAAMEEGPLTLARAG